MCQAFSCIVTKQGKVYYKVGLDSHDLILDKFRIREMDDEIDKSRLKFARVEITPTIGYLYPEGEWQLKVDERIKPEWWDDKHEKEAFAALEKWKEKIYSSFNFEKARSPLSPFTLTPGDVTTTDISNLKRCASVWASVRDSVWGGVWNSVGASVRGKVGDEVIYSSWDSVGAYVGSMFPNIKKWEHIKTTKGEYPYQCYVNLWERGFVVSFDGEIWRLHSGEEAQIVYELEEV